jgi:hypothetical protein
MPTYSLSPLYNGWQGFNAAGQPLNLGTIEVYLAGTPTPTPTYTTSTGAVQNSNPIVLNNGFPPNQIWLEDGVPVKFIVKDAAGATISTDDNVSSLNDLLALLANTSDATKGAGLVGMNQALAYAAGTVGFNLGKRKAFFPTGSAATDTTALQALIDASGNGERIDIFSSFSINARLRIDRPVYLRGIAEGSAFQPVSAAKTEITWAGGVSANAMIRVGKYGVGTDVLWGGGIERIRLNGNAGAAHGLEIADASWGTYRDVYIYNTTVSGLHCITDGTKNNQPSSWNRFYNLFCDMRAALVASANAHGILIEAVNGINAGVTLFYFEGLKVNHSSGDGIRWVTGGDGFVFVKPQMFRADSETGIGVNFTSSDPTDICNHCIFYYPIITSGARFATPGLHIGTRFLDYDGQNINTGLQELIYGPGAPEVAGNSTFGQKFGMERLGSSFDTLIDDSMALVRYDAINNVVHTNAGNWLLATASGAAISATTEPGSGIILSTLNVLNSTSLLSHTSAPNGVGTAQWPSLQLSVNVVQTTLIRDRWGLFNSNADPAGDGIWVEFDPTLSSGQYRLVCSRGSVQTVIVNPLGLTGAGNSLLRWKIDVQPGRANFYLAAAGAPNPQLWAFLGTITTNVPITTTAMAAGVFVATAAAATASVVVADVKLAQRINYL